MTKKGLIMSSRASLGVGRWLAGLLLAAALPAAMAQAPACPVKVGGILPLTGSMAPITKKIAQAAELAIEHVNQGGGVKSCPVQFILRDDQGQPTVGVDAAKYLVEVERVQAFTGTISSGVTGPIISAVTAPSKVVQISCCSSASNFTDGRSGGYFFRTLPTSKTQAYATASEVNRRGMKRLAVIYVNTDFGTDMLRFYRGAHKKLGGEILAEVPYNDNQPNYRAEVTRALASKPEALLLIGFPKDAVTIVREWLSQGGTTQGRTQQLHAHHGLRQRRGRAVRRGLLRHGQRPGTWPQRGRLQRRLPQEMERRLQGPRRAHAVRRGHGHGLGDEHRQGPHAALRSGTPCAACTPQAVHPVGTGPAEFKKALELIRAGKPDQVLLAPLARSSLMPMATSAALRWSGRSTAAKS
jgi:hypothetical protein